MHYHQKKIYEEAKNKAYEAKLQREKELQEANAKTSKAKTEYDTASTSYDDSVNDMHVNASTQKAIFDYYAERSGVAHDNASAARENASITKSDQEKNVSNALSNERDNSKHYEEKVGNYNSAQTASTIVYNENITLENRTGQAYDNARKYWIDLEEYYSANPLMASGGEIYYKMIDTAKRQRFYAVMKNNFGFDYDVAMIMYDLYSGIEDTTAWMEEDYNSYWIPEKNIAKARRVRFLSIISSVVYGEDGFIKQLEWDMIADISSKNYNEFKQKVFNYGIKENDAELLYNSIKENYNIASEKCYVDIAHLMVIINIYLNDSDIVNPGTLAMKMLDGWDSDEITAGFGGDIFGVAGLISPSLGADDYMADLDAVNISRILMTNDNISLIDVIINYYEGIESNKINRAKDFLSNMGGKRNFEKLFERIGKLRVIDNPLALAFKDHVLGGYQNWIYKQTVEDVYKV